jgi:hypothetical protein
VYTPVEREALRDALLERARNDERVVAAAITGSWAAGTADDWSDIDLAFGVAGESLEPVLADWTAHLVEEHAAVHHWDVPWGAWIYRVFLLPNFLELDLAFVQATEFAATSPNFRLVFGEHSTAPGRSFDATATIGTAWHDVRHARAYLDRGKLWAALYFVNDLREQTIALACARLGLPAATFRGVDALPEAVRVALGPTIPASAKEPELRRALHAATLVYLDEVRLHDTALAARLRPVLEV